MDRARTFGRDRGFTLVEIMIVVSIIGLLAGIAVPTYIRARERARVARQASDLRVLADAFRLCNLDAGNYPADETQGVMPSSLDGYFKARDWSNGPIAGELWDWEGVEAFASFGFHAGVSIYRPIEGKEFFEQLDSEIDDGILNTGQFRAVGNGDPPPRYTYVIEW